MDGGDFGGALGVGDRLSIAVRGRRVISATGVRPELFRRRSMERGVRPMALCGRSAEIAGDDQPVVAVQVGGGQMQHDAPHRSLHPRAEFHQMFAQGADLSGPEGGPGGPQPQFLVEHVGGGGQKPAQLISEEAAATGAVDFQAMMQFFDPILDVPAGAVDRFVQMPGRVFEVGDYEAWVVLGLAPRMTYDLGFDDDAPALIPSAGGIAGLAIQMSGLARFARQAPGGAHQARGAALQNLVFPHRHHVLESLTLEEGEQWGGGEAAVQAHPQPSTGEGRPQPRQQPAVDIASHQREKLERLCRYVSRPPVASERLALTASGQVRYTLKTPYRDGTTHIVLEPLDLMARLAALVPTPRMHLTRYHGVFAPHSNYRAAVTPAQRGRGAATPPVSGADAVKPSPPRHVAMSWARRLKRVFGVEIEGCARCGGQLKIIASIEEPQLIAKILSHLERAAPEQYQSELPLGARGPPVQSRLL
jgi:Putative transposase